MNLERSVFESPDSGFDLSDVRRMRLADLLPGLARWSVLAMTGNPNELVDVRSSFLSCFFFLRFADGSFVDVESVGNEGGAVLICNSACEVRGEASLIGFFFNF